MRETYTNPLVPTRRRPGGIFPEGWEFFRPVEQPIWLVKPLPQEEQGQQQQKYSVLGICPCKTPLDSCFDTRRRLLRESAPPPEEFPPQQPRSDKERTELERDRKTLARFCASWHPQDIAWVVGDYWSQIPETRANIRAVVNLCATERYYDPTHFFNDGIEYIWHKVEGGGRLPTMKELQSLKLLSDQLWSHFATEVVAPSVEQLKMILARDVVRLPVVLIHCTHGVNRTGFAVAAFQLFNDQRLSIEEAVINFGLVRGHYINRPELVDALRGLFSQEDLVLRDDGISVCLKKPVVSNG
eukprot:Protomagalhaensia_wolfi_Nauph_80__1319@NODE_178_length_3281_cov_479_197717_g134_i0_p1_GENE_NODE_178_length_3281_cov_479_197717_g134_i0NODE_178_length_3281_cov_479_197717_g134_i0_p1_ORF_typecomplete_len299_score39_85DSPc/PF00782_20/1_2e09Y_phosphatase3/PF13350_6/9e06Y_phosphatase2/PF03162_13/3_1e05Y_phosphatase/PF00102_27/0_02CDKN3/PF05706_12/0_15PTPlike_phytase/PF14566_6/6_8e03PTPlike_phytase/PF14566_6/0_21_NODE_178_length_3281_cov_479_197717_g134_i09421838